MTNNNPFAPPPPAEVPAPTLPEAIAHVEALLAQDRSIGGLATAAALTAVVQAAREQDDTQWVYSVRDSEGREYTPMGVDELIPGSVLLRRLPTPPWEVAPVQDFSKFSFGVASEKAGTYRHPSGFTYDSWLVNGKWEYHIVGTKLTVADNTDYERYGLLREGFCDVCDWHKMPEKVSVEEALKTAWKHLVTRHPELLPTR